MADLTTIVIAFLLVALVITFIFKKLKIGQTYYIITMLKTKRFLPLLDKFAGTPWLGKFADFGLLMGFGAFAADYLWGSQYKSKPKRIAFFLISFILLSGFFYLLFGPMISANPLTKGFVYIFSAGFGLMGFAGWVLMALAMQAWDIIFKMMAGVKACPGVAPIIPGLEIPSIPVTVPLHAWISLLLILLIHEGMHGVLARKVKVTIKNAGILLLGFLPIGAFVEPDDKQLAKKKERDVLRIYAAGPAANFVTFILFSLIISAILIGLVMPFALPQMNEAKRNATEALVIEKVDLNTEFCGDVFPASAYGVISEGDEILSVNGVPVFTLTDYVTEAAKDEEKVRLEFKTADGIVREETFEKNKMGLIGIYLKEQEKEGHEYALEDWLLIVLVSLFASFFNWFILLNFLVAAINFLPTDPFDGGKIAKIIFLPLIAFTGWSKAKRQKAIGKFFVTIILALFILNAIPLFIL
jgi:membrane-associated protease RseP (regulator of RpoE activity)